MPRRAARGPELPGEAWEQYQAWHWGKPARKSFAGLHAHSVVRQRMVDLGRLRQVIVRSPEGLLVALRPPRPWPVLAAGERDGRLYVLRQEGLAREGFWGPAGLRGEILQTDYDAVKGSFAPENAYWYHQHEPPFADLIVARDGCATYRGGGYRVTEAGLEG